MQALGLEYHDVVEPDDFDGSGFQGAGPASYKLTYDDFERHAAAIHAAIAAPAQRATDWLSHPTSARPLFITFDDGGVSAWSRIADTLERRGWYGHFFVTAGRVGTPTFLSADQIRDLSRRGHVIGSHSYSHPTRMGGLTREELRVEWRRSQDTLADILGYSVVTASVPGGFYTRPVAETAAEAGFKVLFTSAPTTKYHEVDGCRVLGRYTLRRWSKPETAAALAAGRWGPRAAQAALYGGLTLVRRAAGDHYTTIRRIFWARRS
jgi:peptidoglycan/xylan/chitin deacetylase (PgdA/CDA1 family)